MSAGFQTAANIDEGELVLLLNIQTSDTVLKDERKMKQINNACAWICVLKG